MTLKVRWQLLGIDAEGGSERILPGVVGMGDIGYPFHEVAVPHPSAGTIPAATEILGAYRNRPLSPMYGDTAGARFHTKIPDSAVELGFHFTGTATPGADIETYSFSFMMEMKSGYLFGQQADFLEVRNAAGALVWGLGFKPSAGGNWDQNFYPGILSASGGAFAWGTSALVQNARHRFEVQVQPTNPKVSLRVYRETAYGSNTWTAVGGNTLSANPTSTAGNKVLFGHFVRNAGLFGFEREHCRIHVWDTYNADGLFPNYVPPLVPPIEWSYHDGTDFHALTIEGYHDGTSTVPANFLRASRTKSLRGRREKLPPATVTNVNGSYGVHENQKWAAWFPSGSPPPGGWPVIVWVVCDFFVTGYASQFGTLDYQWIRNDWLQRGFATISIGVRNAAALTSITNPSRPNDGIWPDQIHDVKNAVHHFTGTLGAAIDPTKIIVGGHSGGGFMAMAAMATRDLNDTAHSVDYRRSPGTPDPEFLGAYNVNSPLDLSYLQANDLMHPYYNPFTGPTARAGVLRAVIAALMGSPDNGLPNVSHLAMSRFATINAAKLVPTFGCTSGADHLIPRAQALSTHAAYATAGVDYVDYYSPGATHGSCARNLPQETFAMWAKDLFA